MPNLTAWARVTRWILLGACVFDLVALRSGRLRHDPTVLMGLVALTLLIYGIHLVLLVRTWMVDGRRARTVAAIIGSAGIVVALAAGSANWLLGLQGFVILTVGETVQLQNGQRLQEFEAGPLARIDEMDMTLGLEDLELVPAAGDTFFPVSTVRVGRGGRDSEPLRLSPHELATFGRLRFHQGAFGFAPKIVILQGPEPERKVFDRVVPFLTQRHGADGVSFEGSFSIGAEDLRVEGRVDLASLDEEMRGHSMLDLVVLRGERILGEGRLLPGHFAEIEEGYRVGYTGLEQWSEIVISRRDYTRLVLVGGLLALLGGALWPIAVWRRW